MSSLSLQLFFPIQLCYLPTSWCCQTLFSAAPPYSPSFIIDSFHFHPTTFCCLQASCFVVTNSSLIYQRDSIDRFPLLFHRGKEPTSTNFFHLVRPRPFIIPILLINTPIHLKDIIVPHTQHQLNIIIEKKHSTMSGTLLDARLIYSPYVYYD